MPLDSVISTFANEHTHTRKKKREREIKAKNRNVESEIQSEWNGRIGGERTQIIQPVNALINGIQFDRCRNAQKHLSFRVIIYS